MRIAIFSECYLPVTNGVVTSIVTLRETLRAMGHTVYLFAPGTPQPEDDTDVFRLPELPFPRHPYHFARPFPRLNVDFAALDVDIIHCQHPFTVGRLGADTAKKYGIPMVYTAHSLYDTMVASAKSPLLRKMGPKAMQGVIRRFCSRADYVIAPTRHTRDSLRADGVRARYAVVPSGVIPPTIRPEARRETRERLGLAAETPLLLYIGRLGPEKRVDILLEAVSLLETFALPSPAGDFHLAVVGDGQCREDLEALSEELGLKSRVTFVGERPHDHIGEWYAAGDIFTMPSPAETQGLVLVEAMACGLPCLTVDRGGPREIVVQGETGMRVPLDSQALARSLDFLLRNPDICQKLGENGRGRARLYSPDAMARGVLNIYQTALAAPRRPDEKTMQKLTTVLRRRRDKIRRVRSRTAAKRKKLNLKRPHRKINMLRSIAEMPNRENQNSPESTQRPGYHIMTWGCQMNEEDSEQISLYMEQMGYHAVSEAAQAEVVLLNTCSVRAKPEEKVWSELGRLKDIKREHPDMIIGVCGCMAQVESVALKRRAPHIDLIVGTNQIASIPDLITELKTGVRPETSGRGRQFDNVIPLTVHAEAEGRRPEANAGAGNGFPIKLKTLTALELPPRKGAIVADVPQRKVERRPKLKAHVPIMYGCDKFCTFCIVPFTRGRERSRPTQEVLEEIQALALGGTREVTLLGQTVNSYGKNLPEGRVPFAALLEQINAIRGLQRIRFTSPYPRDFTDELIEAIASLEKVCEHVHLPLQVADDALLLEMHRGYTVARYREIVEQLRGRVPGIAITTDIMLGYPGETDEQFRNTMQVVEALRFDAAFMFAYSPRPNTKAAEREDQLPQAVKVDRLNQLIAMQNRITVEINQEQVGQTLEVLVEGRSHKDPHRLAGYTRTLKMVHFSVPEGGPRSADSLIGKTVPVFAQEAHLKGFIGEYAG